MKPTYAPEYDNVNWGGGYSLPLNLDMLPSHTHITRPTRTEKMYSEIKSACLRRAEISSKRLVFDVEKNRNGNNGVLSFEEAIDFCAEMLCQLKFDDGNHMFQESLRIKLAEAMKDVLLGDDCVPSEQAIKDYIERR
jgi:hypothetical protein